MLKHFRYLKYVIRHKWYVFIECCKLGIPLRGIVHDISKLKPSEWIPYARYFYGDNWPDWDKAKHQCHGYPYKMTKQGISEAFDIAWLHHQNRNKHHWQYWLLVNDSSSNEFVIQEPGNGHELFLSRNNRHLAMFDRSILWKEDMVVPEMGMNENAYLYAKEIRDRLNKGPVAIPMPDKYIKEMVADWRGAGRAINGHDETAKWYTANKDNMILHPTTRARVEKLLKEGR